MAHFKKNRKKTKKLGLTKTRHRHTKQTAKT